MKPSEMPNKTLESDAHRSRSLFLNSEFFVRSGAAALLRWADNMKLRLFVNFLCIVASVSIVGCSFIAETVIESAFESAFGSAFGSDKDRRQKQYEDRGIDPKCASRLVFEDEVWGSD